MANRRRIRSRCGFGNGTGELAAGRIVFLAESPNAACLVGPKRRWNARGKMRTRSRGCNISPRVVFPHLDVVVEHAHDLPALVAGEGCGVPSPPHGRDWS